MRAITATVSPANPQAIVRLDDFATAVVGVQIVASGGAQFTLSHSSDDPNDLVNPIVVAPVAPAWTPANLPGLVAWYDGQKASSIILNGSTVSQWNDQSGHGYNAVQGTASLQPTYNATGLNGKPALVFSGTAGMSLHAPVPAGAFASAITMYWVSTNTNASTAGGLMLRIVTGTGSPAPLAFLAAQAYCGDGTVAGVTLPSGCVSFTTPTLYGANYTAAGFAFTDWTNGTQTASSSDTRYGDAATALDFGDTAAQGWGGFGTLGESIACNGITTSDRQKLEGYLAWKWGLASLLPAGHPFKPGPPDTNGNPIAPPPPLTGAESDGTNIVGALTIDNCTLIAAPAIVAPDGTTGSVQKIQENTAAGQQHGVYFTDSGHSQITISAYFKPAGRNICTVFLQNPNTMAYFDLVNGIVLSTITGANRVIDKALCQPAANGWFKCTIQAHTTDSTNWQWCNWYASNQVYGGGGSPIYTGDGASGVYVWRIKETSP